MSIGEIGRPYKLLVWGPGGLGAICIWEAMQSEELDVVGVRCYSPAKVGVDAGEYVGLAPSGVLMTDDVEALLEFDADAVVYCALDMGTFHTDDEILRILEAGKNVITPLPYQQAHLVRDEEFLKRLDAACVAGNATFHATGVDPDTVSERVLQTLTGLCTDITSIKVQEVWECSNNSPEIMGVVGIGKSPEEARANPISFAACENILKAVVHSTGHALLGQPFARIDASSDYVATLERIESLYLTIEAGQVARVTHRMAGFEHQDDTEPFFTMEYNWLIGAHMVPEGISPGQYFAINIDGRPGVRVAIDIRAALGSDERLLDLGKLQTEPGYHSVIAACLQALPEVVAAPPGLLPSFEAPVHWRRRLTPAARTL